MDSRQCNGWCNSNGDVHRKVDQLLMLLNMPYDHLYLIEHACDTVPGLCTMLLPDSSHSSDVTLVSDLIQILPEICSPKELVVVLLEQLDTFKDDALYLALLPPLGMSIRKLPSKRHMSLSMALETLTAHITTLPTPDEPTDCIISLPSGSGVVEERLDKVIGALLSFIAPFVDDILQLSVSERCQQAANRQISDITRCLLGLLGDVLSRVNLCVHVEEVNSSKTLCLECAELCVSLLDQLHPDVIKLIADVVEHNKAIERGHDANMRKSQHAGGDLVLVDAEDLYNLEQPLPLLGVAVLLYLVHGEKICRNSIPQVYRHHYLLESNLHLLHMMLNARAVAIVHKGLILGSSLFIDVGVKTLDGSMLEHETMFCVVEAVVAAMTSSRVKVISQSAIKLLHTMLKSFTENGRCGLLQYLLGSCSNKNVQGHTISLIKDEIDEALSSGDVSSLFLSGSSLKHLLLKVFEPVPDGYRSNLITSLSDRVMAALNLLRYLFIRDPRSQNRTGMWDLLPTVKENLLEPLRIGIALCRADINTEMQKLQNGETASVDSVPDWIDGHMQTEYHVGRQCMPDLTPKQQMEAMHSTLVSLDMMDSVRCRVEELADI